MMEIYHSYECNFKKKRDNMAKRRTFKKTKPSGQYRTPLGNLKASCPNITADLTHATTLILDKNVEKILFRQHFLLAFVPINV